MKRIITSVCALCFAVAMFAQGWPANYGGVMLQGFYWDSYSDSKWSKLEKQAKDLATVYDLVWIPQSGNCNGASMGYDDCYWFPGANHYTSSFGDETQLRSMIKTFKANGIGTIADVVINHRKPITGWFGFPTETYNGVTYKMSSTDVCSDDDGGAAKTQATKQGVSLSTNKDTGEDWSGMRDLDHKSTNVQNVCKAYTKALIEDLGYTGFRYDMVKGYGATYVGMYNANCGVKYSVGEYWDGNASTVQNWINGTKVDGVIQSGAFDFAFRYTCRDAQPVSWANDKVAYVYVYVDGGSTNAAWPGKTMTWNASRTVNGVTGWFEYTVPTSLTASGRAIFSDGASMQFPASGASGFSIAGKSYCYDGTWNAVTTSNDTGTGVKLYFRIPTSRSTSAYNYNKLNNTSIISNSNYRRYAVTFVENHDTEYRSASSPQDPVRKDTLAFNAWMLANPGTPCVFFKHWKDYKNDIKNMILARKLAGITNQSVYNNLNNATTSIVRQVGPSSSNYTLLAYIGIAGYTVDNAWVKILDGHHYGYYLNKSLETVWVSEPSQEVEADIKVKLTAISNTAGAKVVYTTNGQNPTASSPSVASGATITVPKGSTLKVGLLKNGAVSSIQTREYWAHEEFVLPDFCTREADERCAFFEAPSGWTNVKCWNWDNSYNYTTNTWPGVACTKVGTNNGHDVWKWTYSEADRKAQSSTNQGIIFSSGSNQTSDLAFVNGGYYDGDGELLGVVPVSTGIDNIYANTAKAADNSYYTLSGQRIDKPTQRGIYIHQGRKIIVK